jgi:hypothetical protein
LVIEPKATEAVFRLHPGPVTVMGNEFAESLLREMRLDKPALTAGATVAHLAYYLAEHLGSDPIIFVGQDLGFSDGLYYTPGTSYEEVWRPELGRFCTMEMKQWERIARERYILRRIPDQQGRPMYTEERLFTYLQQFERDFGRSKSRIIDATEGGAAKRGTTPMTLAAAIEQYCAEPLPMVPDDYPGVQPRRSAEAVACLRARREESINIEQIGQQTLPLLREIADHLDDQPRVNRAIARVDELRGRMDAFGATYDLVTQLTQKSELERFRSDRQLAAAKATGADRQRRQVERDLANVESVIAAAIEFQSLMSECIERTGNFAATAPAARPASGRAA